MISIHASVAEARQRLRDAGLSPKEAELSARLLAEHVLGWTPEQLIVSGGEPATAEFQSRYDVLMDRRANREPLAYILGRQEFWGLTFEVSPAVLIPRPETELIVQAALEYLPDVNRAADVVDVCTGCGCIAVALARERPAARVIAADVSAEALEVARRNVGRLGVSGRVQLVKADLLESVRGAFDLITANPPYVLDGDRHGLQPEVGNHEPAIALFGEADGLGIIRRLVEQAPSRLRLGGMFMMEFGFGQDEEIEALIEKSRGLQLVGLRRDLQGIARTAVAVRR